MSAWSAHGPFVRVASAVPGVVHLRAATGLDLFLEGVPAQEAARALPPSVPSVSIERAVDAEGAVVLLGDHVRLRANSWRVHEPRPDLYVAPLARFAPTAREERTIRWLLRLLRVPGITRLIRAWHAWRTR